MTYNWYNFFSYTVRDLEECPTTKATARAHSTHALESGVVDLSIGDPHFNSQEHIKLAAVDAIIHNDTHYTGVGGSVNCKKAVARKFQEENNLPCSLDNVIVSNGASQVMSDAMMATLNAEDEVIIPLPHWDSYVDMTLLHNAVPITITNNADFKITPEQLEAAITPRTKWFILTNPNNPGGRVYNNDELKRFADVLRKPEYQHVRIMADEAFEHIVFVEKPISFASIEGMGDRTLTVNGISKPYSMTGWRIGYGVGPIPLLNKMHVVQSNTTYSPCSVAQAATIAALLPEYRPQLAQYIQLLKDSRDLACSLIEQVEAVSFLKPDAGYFIFMNVTKLLGAIRPDTGEPVKSPNDICNYLFEVAKVAVVAGNGFGIDNYVRVSFAAPKDYILDGYTRIINALNALKI